MARAYLQEIGPLSGLAEESPATYEDLNRLAAPNGIHVLFLHEPPVPRAGWTLIRGGLVDQMVFAGANVDNLPNPAEMRLLTAPMLPWSNSLP